MSLNVMFAGIFRDIRSAIIFIDSLAYHQACYNWIL